MKKKCGIFLTLLMTICLMFCVPFSASASNGTVNNDGLEVSIITDKDAYKADEDINIAITVKNTNNYELSDISVQALLPNNLKLKLGDSSKTIDVIAIGETVTMNLVAVYVASGSVSTSPDQNASPQTGDLGIGMYFIIFAGAAVLCILAFKFRKQTGRVFSILICIAVLGVSDIIPARAEGSGSDIPNPEKLIARSSKISVEFNVPSGKTTVSALVNYSITEFALDSDGDGLADGIEALLGLDTKSKDTDNDGLTDGFEYNKLLTDPAVADSDKNGVSDANEDSDSDGLTNASEQEFGTNPLKADTDNDGLTDGDEINKYKTHPLLKDTDGDDINDGDEVKMNLNPSNSADGTTKLQQETDSTVFDDAILKSESWLKPSVSGSVSGNISKNVDITLSDNDSFTDNRSVLSDVVDVNTTYTEPLKLNFKYTTPYNGNKNNIYIIQYKNDDIELVPTTIDESTMTISGDLKESGTYFVIDLEEFLRGLGIDVNEFLEEYEAQKSQQARTVSVPTPSPARVKSSIPEKTMGKADICFVLDVTGSMDDDIRNVANNINTFVEKLVSEYNIDANFSLITYNDYYVPISGKYGTRIHKNNSSNWFTNVNSFKTAVNTVANTYCGYGGSEVFMDGLGMAEKELSWRRDSSKFVILLTDEKGATTNRYGFNTRLELAKKFKNDDICVSVITNTNLRTHYEDFLTQTDGIYADIRGNFSDILIGLADKIGAVTNQGEWVLLKGYKAVRLSGTLADAYKNDSDNDGLTDANELGTSYKKNLSGFVQKLLIMNNVPEYIYKDKSTVTLWDYTSNPTLNDTDFDGINDDVDDDPLDNSFKGYYHYKESKESCVSVNKIEFTVDYSKLFTKSGVYDDELSTFASLFVGDIYKNTYIEVTDGLKGGSDDPENLFRLFGMSDIDGETVNSDVKNYHISGSDYTFDKDDETQVAVGHKKFLDGGTEKTVVVVSVRGTNGTNTEWSSNFDVGADTPEYYAATGSDHPDWKNKLHHKGFDVAANRCLDKINSYLSEHNITSGYILITGHSRGAGIANILGKHFEDNPNFVPSTYTFASPNTTTVSETNAAKYGTIFNVVNEDDLIPYLPITKWNFTKYGTTKSISVEDKYEDSSPIGNTKWTWEWLIGKDYNNDGGTQRTINKFSALCNTREEIYILDATDDGKVWENNLGHTTYSGAQTELNSLDITLTNEKLRRFCSLSIVGNSIYHVEVNYCPAYLMQMLANMTTGVGPMLGHDVNNKYADAKTSFIASSGRVGVGGMTHPHEPITYYLIAHNGV